MKQQEHEAFSYTYSAEQQAEVAKIRRKYQPQGEDSLTKLRRLDRSVTQSGTVASLIVGILGTLIFGSGMSFVMVWPETMFFLGIILGLVGAIPMLCAYPLYRYTVRKAREKIGPEILRLADELLK